MSREIAQGCGVSFINCLYLVPLIIGQNFCTTCATSNKRQIPFFEVRPTQFEKEDEQDLVRRAQFYSQSTIQMAWLPLLPDASNVSPILFPFHMDREKKRERRAETARRFPSGRRPGSTSTMPSWPSCLKKKLFCPRVGGFRRGARCQPDVHRRPTNLEFNRRIATGK